MHERHDEQTEREQALPEHETRPPSDGTAEVTRPEVEPQEPDEPAIDPGEGPPPVTRSG